MASGIDYEFRTTVVPGIHSEQDFAEIGQWIKGAKSYFLQEYRERHILDPKLKSQTAGQTLDLQKIKKILKADLKNVGIRENN